MEKLTTCHPVYYTRTKSNFPTKDLPQEEKDGTKKFYAWFSKKAKDAKYNHWDYNSHVRQHVSNIYLNEKKEEVECTHVGRACRPPLFDDIEYRGIVIKSVRVIYE